MTEQQKDLLQKFAALASLLGLIVIFSLTSIAFFTVGNGMTVAKREATLLGSRNAATEDFETVLNAMRTGQVPTAALNTHRTPLAEVPTAFATLMDPAQGVVKALIEC